MGCAVFFCLLGVLVYVIGGPSVFGLYAFCVLVLLLVALLEEI